MSWLGDRFDWSIQRSLLHSHRFRQLGFLLCENKYLRVQGESIAYLASYFERERSYWHFPDRGLTSYY